jgi:hypothetical protein
MNIGEAGHSRVEYSGQASRREVYAEILGYGVVKRTIHL